MQATARIYFQKAPAKRTKDDLCPVKLCITHNRVRKYYSISELIKDRTWLFISEEDIKKVTGDNPRGRYRDIASEYKRITNRAEDIINAISTFSFGQFEDKMFQRTTEWDNVFKAFIDHIQALRVEQRFGYAASFESTLRAVKEFNEKKVYSFTSRQKVSTRFTEYQTGRPLNFVDITPGWLKSFELWLQKKGRSRSTVGIYTRNIRVLVNQAITIHKIKAENPFTAYETKSSDGRKIALSPYNLGLIANYKSNNTQETFFRDVFMFSFLGCGMNLADIARLKYSNIENDELSFIREKTKNSAKNNEKLRIPITSKMREIIDSHGNKAIGYDSYIFPILNPAWREERKFAEVRQLTKQVNKYIKRIARSVGIQENVSSYVARHSWATIARNSGTSVEFISSALGHSSVKVTQTYLKSFEKSTREKHSTKIEGEVYGQAAG
jgi:integrase